MTSPRHADNPVQRLILAGFMGSGKTTTGRLLAMRLGWRFFDLDAEVERRAGTSVPAIFARLGEPAFRLAELAALKALLQQTDAVIALGGGAPEVPEIQQLLRADRCTTVVHLEAPFEVLYSRCLRQAADPGATARPLLGEPEAAELRYRRRLAAYAAIAHHTADAAASPVDVTTAILSALHLADDAAHSQQAPSWSR